MKKKTQFDRLLSFLDQLEEAKIPFRLSRNRYDAISVEAIAPGERWEVDFLQDGTIDVERFRSNGEVTGEATLQELFELCSDSEIPAAKDATA